MKNTLLLLLIVAGFFCGTQSAEAAQYCFKKADGSVQCESSPGFCNNSKSNQKFEDLDPHFRGPSNPCVPQSQINNPAAAGNKPVPVDGPNPLDKFGQFIGNLILSTSAWIAGQAGNLLDVAVESVVIEMGTDLRDGDMASAINRTWTIIRDFANLLFIFGFIYIGVLAIYDYESASTKRRLAQLIMAALLINFSLFITKVVIDVSNVLALQIYESGFAGKDIAQTMVELLRLKDIYTITGQELANLTRGGAFWYYIGASLFLLIAAFVFIAGAILLIIRYVALILIMVASPILFAATVFPQTSKMASDLWKKLISYSFFAPAYFFLLFVSFQLIAGLNTAINPGAFSAELQRGAGVALSSIGAGSVILNFFIITTFLIFALLAAQKMGVYGGEQAVKAGRWTRGVATGFAGRNTVGRYFDWRDRKLEEKGVSSTSVRRQIASKLANAKFGGTYSRKQVREAEEQAQRKEARYKQNKNISAAISAGAESTSPQQKIAMERSVSRATTEQLVAMLSDAKPDTPEYRAIVENMSASQYDAVMKAKEEDLNDEAKSLIARQRAESIRTSITESAQKQHAQQNPNQPPLSPDEALKQGIAKASGAQLKVLGAETIEQNAGYLSASQIDDIQKSADFTETEKVRINQTREDQLKDRFDSDPTFVSKLKDEDVAKLPKDILKDNRIVPLINAGALSQMKRTLSKEDRAAILTNIQNAQLPPDNPISQWLRSSSGQEF